MRTQNDHKNILLELLIKNHPTIVDLSGYREPEGELCISTGIPKFAVSDTQVFATWGRIMRR